MLLKRPNYASLSIRNTWGRYKTVFSFSTLASIVSHCHNFFLLINSYMIFFLSLPTVHYALIWENYLQRDRLSVARFLLFFSGHMNYTSCWSDSLINTATPVRGCWATLLITWLSFVVWKLLVYLPNNPCSHRTTWRKKSVARQHQSGINLY